ncbi:MAG: hypothetical protein HKN76_18875 [Saprospiraceae bacterium]|nr:hypothetical protein [Saprospiraceae bacterium]
MAAQISSEMDLHKLENPITAQYLREHLSPEDSKLFLTPDGERRLREKLKSDLRVQRYFSYLKDEAAEILNEPLLKRELEGFRLLFVSRDMVQRMSILCMLYRLQENSQILDRINDELLAVCDFKDWNPQHFLDVAEMSFAVALAVDWVGKALPKETLHMAKQSLIEKGILPGFNTSEKRMFWIDGSNNWNAVCHGGLVAAALVIADIDPELAAKTISRALEKLPNSLKEYAPDGIYPEGPTYWGYGTAYTIIAASALNSALGTDFGITQSPGFMESALFRLQATAPSGNFFNFADSGDSNNGSGSLLMTWFAAQTGDGLFFDQIFFDDPNNAGRFAGLGLIWLSQYEQQKVSKLPLLWCGKGVNPVAVFRNEENDPRQFYLGVKGGKAHLSHGNMDAGSFVFDLNGVRWVVDPGNQRYYLLNKIGFNLAGHCQDCPRWTLLTKQNQGHNTITVNETLFNVDGFAPITKFEEGGKPYATIDLTDLYFGNVDHLERKFSKESGRSILIEDFFVINDSTQSITWGLMTVADIKIVEDGAILMQENEELKLTILSPDDVKISIVALDPPPMEIDKKIEKLKRIEIRIPAYTINEGEGRIKVRLSGE